MHKAKNCVITCMDFRMQKAYAAFMADRDMLGGSDLISVAGCSRDLVKPLEEAHREVLFRQMDLSMKLHNPDNIVLLDHQDCGGYAQDGTIASGLNMEEDRKHHVEWAGVAKKVLTERYPGKGIKVYYVQLDGTVEEI